MRKMRMKRSLFAACLAVLIGTGSVYATPLFTPTIDTTKESGWGSTPDTNNAGAISYDGSPCGDLYVTDDPDYLYIGYCYGGDYHTGDAYSGHTFIMLDTTNNFGATYDPYKSTTTYGSTSFRPDYAMRSYYNANGGAKDVQMVRWNGTGWDNLGAMADTEHAETAATSGSWAEIRFKLSDLHLQTGDTVKICYYWRAYENANGFSDSTPWNSTASSGSATSGSITAYYTYTIRSDNINPTVVSNYPANAAVNQNKNVNIVARVSDNANFSLTNVTILVEGNDAYVNGAFQAGFSGTIVTNTASKDYTITINPASDFEYEQHVNVEVYVSDASGNTTERSFYFDVRQDNVAPTYDSFSPVPGSTGNARSTHLQFLVNDDAHVNASSIFVKVNGVNALTNTVFQTGFDGALSQMISTGNGYTVTVDFTDDFDFEEPVTIFIRAGDLKNNIRTTNYTFTIIADTVKPLVSLNSPVGPGNDIDSIISFRTTDNDQVVSNSITVVVDINGTNHEAITAGEFNELLFSGSYEENSGNGYNIEIVPQFNFKFSDTVNVNVTCSDSKGNTTNMNWNFGIASGDVNAPTITKQNPANGDDDVEPNAMIYFETADNVEVLHDSIYVTALFPDGTNRVALTNGTFQTPFNGPGSKIVTNAYGGYDVTLDYTGYFGYTNNFTVNARIEDSTFNVVSAYWSFTVRPPDTTPPEVEQFIPADASEDIPISTTISFNTIDDYNILSNYLTVWIDGEVAMTNAAFSSAYGGPASALIGNSRNGFTVIIDPASDFAYGSTVTVVVRAEDSSSNFTIVTNTFEPQGLEQAVARTSVIIPSQGINAVQVKVNRTGYANAVIYNLRGEVIATIPERYYNIGDYIEWNGIFETTGEVVGAGWYFITITGSDINTTVKVMVAR